MIQQHFNDILRDSYSVYRYLIRAYLRFECCYGVKNTYLPNKSAKTLSLISSFLDYNIGGGFKSYSILILMFYPSEEIKPS